MKNTNVNETLGSAVYTLVTSTGNVRDCVRRSYLQFERLNDEDIPDELQSKWHQLLNRLSPPSIEGSDKIRAALNQLDLYECVEIAELINELNREIDK